MDFPKGDDIANVGLAILQHKATKPAIEYLDDFIAKCPATKNAQAVELNVGGDPVEECLKKCMMITFWFVEMQQVR